MFVENFICNNVWKQVTSIDDGDGYLIQNTSKGPVEYVVLENEPDSTQKGGVLFSGQQLSFKKVAGNLYVKAPTASRLYIEKVE